MSLRVTLAVGLIAIPLLVMARTPAPGAWTAIDGDTLIDPNGEHIRLLRIDSPEMPGHCRIGRQCVPGDPYAAKVALQHALDSGEPHCEGERRDRYDRRLAECVVTAPGNGQTVNISDWMVASGHAEWYRGHAVAEIIKQQRAAQTR